MFTDLWASHFEAWDHKYQGGKHVFTIKHDVNLNYSRFTKEYISSLLETAIGKKVNFEAMSPNSVTFTFEDYPKDWRKNESNNTGLNNNLHRSNDPEKVMQE